MSRWPQVPLYLGLIVAQAVYVATHTHPKHFKAPAALPAVGGIKVSTPLKAQD